jgi:hypothetical protein
VMKNALQTESSNREESPYDTSPYGETEVPGEGAEVGTEEGASSSSPEGESGAQPYGYKSSGVGGDGRVVIVP